MKILTYTVPDEDDGRLIKRVVRGRMQVSHKQFTALKMAGGLMVDGVVVRADYVLRAGQVIAVAIEDDAPAAPPDAQPVDVVYEDEDIIVVNKPAPLACQSSPKQNTMTLENRMAHRYPDLTFRPVNRLDRGTSGLMVCAGNAHAQMLLSRQLHTEDFVRAYLAVVVGIAPERGAIDAPIAKADGATVRRAVSDQGKRAVTRYERVALGKSNSIVRLRLETGRTHQIRVHMAHIGHPVFGDFLYGAERPDVLPGRFALHACAVCFVHPQTGEKMAFESELPGELGHLIDVE